MSGGLPDNFAGATIRWQNVGSRASVSVQAYHRRLV